MKKIWLVGFCTILFWACQKESYDVLPTSDFDDYQTIKTLTNEEGVLIKESDQFSVIITENESGDVDQHSGSNRFIAGNLPAELKGKRKAKIVFSGEVKQHPYSAQVLGVGRPLKLIKIRLK